MNKKFSKHVAICLAALALLAVVWHLNLSLVTDMIKGLNETAAASHNPQAYAIQVAALQKLTERLSVSFIFLAALAVFLTLVPAFRGNKAEARDDAASA